MKSFIFLLVVFATLLALANGVRIGDDDETEKPKAKAKDGKAKDGKAKDGKAKDGKAKDGKAKGKEGSKIAKGSKKDVWFQATDYLEKNHKKDGAVVNKNLKADMVSIGGGLVRGIVTEKAMKNGTKLVVIPKKAWVNLDNFPEMRDSDLKCSDDENEIKIATALAIEDKKKEKSKWAQYIQTLPTKDDFHSFYPKWAEEETLKEFEGLKMVKDLREFQKDQKELGDCWKKWHSSTDVEGAKALTWDDARLGLARWRSRNHNTRFTNSNHSNALLPAADLMNTGPKPNTHWYFEDTDGDGHADQYTLQTEGDVEAGAELLERYCASCANDEMLKIWGIYVEDNDNKLEKQTEGCDKLLPKAKAMLEPAPLKGLLAPRCKKETLEKDQGPMRCSMARLAWESCAPDEGKAKAKDEAGGNAPDAKAKGSMIEEGVNN